MSKKKVDLLDVETGLLMKLTGGDYPVMHILLRRTGKGLPSSLIRLCLPKALSPAQLCAHSLSLTGNVFKENGASATMRRSTGGPSMNVSATPLSGSPATVMRMLDGGCAAVDKR